MSLENRPKRFNRTLMTGYALLIPASLSQRILIHTFHARVDLADGITGLLYGLTIGLFFLGIRRMMRDDGHASC